MVNAEPEQKKETQNHILYEKFEIASNVTFGRLRILVKQFGRKAKKFKVCHLRTTKKYKQFKGVISKA